jgi:hypothetical protein
MLVNSYNHRRFAESCVDQSTHLRRCIKRLNHYGSSIISVVIF